MNETKKGNKFHNGSGVQSRQFPSIWSISPRNLVEWAGSFAVKSKIVYYFELFTFVYPLKPYRSQKMWKNRWIKYAFENRAIMLLNREIAIGRYNWQSKIPFKNYKSDHLQMKYLMHIKAVFRTKTI